MSTTEAKVKQTEEQVKQGVFHYAKAWGGMPNPLDHLLLQRTTTNLRTQNPPSPQPSSQPS